MISLLKHFFKIQFIVLVVAVIAGVYYPNILNRLKVVLFRDYKYQEYSNDNLPLEAKEIHAQPNHIFTATELLSYDGKEDRPLYLALLGSVYDVSKGIKHYGPGCSYNFFIGRDASVHFVTGDFENYNSQTADDVLKLAPSELLSLAHWKEFYDKEYHFKGKLIGRFYDEQGTHTAYHHTFLSLVDEAAKIKASNNELREKYPDCNIEWTKEKGTRVWCTTASGGKNRQWIGSPRKLFELNQDSYRCACIPAEDIDSTAIMIKPYEDCDRLADQCFYSI